MKKYWNKKQIKFHEEAAEKLETIKNEVKSYLLENRKKVYEADVLDFIKNAYKKHGLVNDHKKEFAICAFGKNTREVHYFPKNKGIKLKPNSLILLDIWARLNKKDAPYADMTWMFFYRGWKVENRKWKEIQKTWKVLVKARGEAIEYAKKEVRQGRIPRGLDIDRVSHDVIGKAGLGKAIKHTIGHSLGFKSPHGDLPGINWREYSPILKNVGYTIEPGIYLEKFGMRTEIDFYISEGNKLVATTTIQKEVEKIF